MPWEKSPRIRKPELEQKWLEPDMDVYIYICILYIFHRLQNKKIVIPQSA